MNEMTELKRKALLPDRHPTQDFFIADIFDNLPVKDDIASMEHPIFSLATKTDMRELNYKNGDVSISIIPSARGLPTIHDKDVLLYCASLLMAEINEGRTPPKTLRISTHDLLVATNRPTDGRSYSRLRDALLRLRGVTIRTNIKTNRRNVEKGFGLIEGYEIVESSRIKDRMVRLEVTLSDWFYNSILGKEVLTINRDYFRLRKPIERRIYEIARKHCGRSPEWSIKLSNLKDKTGSTGSLVKFRFIIKKMASTDHLPDYSISISDNDIVTVRRRKAAPLLDLNEMPALKPETIAKGERITKEAGTGWDYREIRSQFTQQLMDGFKPSKPDGAFIEFVKKKVAERP